MERARNELEPCEYEDPCCFRTKRGSCKLLSNSRFRDGKCHFRKACLGGENLYDKEQKSEHL